MASTTNLPTCASCIKAITFIYL
ncbi:rCG48136, isoform CRA_b [Rattus norvegicus]|uniref:RCG48136, isoform CRA_b n=1 Tax=Rattus norvegicus TaxID=10116 RepID=A6HY82_RAT|nr:rCG48136, isoform CRA_b [Rattus norvegicus]